VVKTAGYDRSKGQRSKERVLPRKGKRGEGKGLVLKGIALRFDGKYGSGEGLGGRKNQGGGAGIGGSSLWCLGHRTAENLNGELKRTTQGK